MFAKLAAFLDRHRFELHLGLLQRRGNFLSLVPPDVRIHDLRVTHARWAPPRLLRLIWNLRPDVILVTLLHFNLLLLMLKPLLPPDTRLLVRQDLSLGATLPELRRPWLWSWMVRHLCPWADSIVCPSDFMLNDLAVNFSIPRAKLLRICWPA